jgi:hypothetical protein
MKAVGTAQQALNAAREEEIQARLDQPNKHKAYLAIKDARCQALRVRRESFKIRVRAAGLQTKFISLSDKDMEVLEQMEDQEEDEEQGGRSQRYTPAFVSLERGGEEERKRRGEPARRSSADAMRPLLLLKPCICLSLL